MTQRGIKENADYDDMAGPFMVIVMFGTLLLMVIPNDYVDSHFLERQGAFWVHLRS